MGYAVTRTKICRTCGKSFHPHLGRSQTSHWCSRACYYAGRRVYLRCAQCGVEFYHLIAKPRQFCSRACWRGDRSKGYRSKLFKGDRHVTARGYVYVYAPDHPSVQGKPYKRVAEHRLVMEKLLDRLLEPWESVHHKDNDRKNNAPENLEMWVTAHPTGVCVQTYIEEILRLRKRVHELEKE